MPKFIKLTRIKDSIESDIYLNINNIISFYSHKEGGCYVEVAFPDTIRKYIIKESVEEIRSFVDPFSIFDEAKIEIKPLSTNDDEGLRDLGSIDELSFN